MVNVVFASDNNFAPYLGVAMYSLLKNNQNIEDLNIFILDTNISKNNKNKLNVILEDYSNASLIFVKVPNLEKLLNIHINIKNFSIDTYSRLFISSLLPKNIEKIIYLDCDALILKSLKEIWETDLGDNYCAGVLDLATPFFRESIGLLPNDNYINAGFLLINLKKWRNDNIEQDFINYLKINNGNILNNDQGIINFIFKNKILIVNPVYNFASMFFEWDYDKIMKFYNTKKFYSKKVISNAKENIVFLHFSIKPWLINVKNPCKNFYLFYAFATPFKDEICIEGNISRKTKFLNFCMSNVPSFIFMPIYHFYSSYIFKLFIK